MAAVYLGHPAIVARLLQEASLKLDATNKVHISGSMAFYALAQDGRTALYWVVTSQQIDDAQLAILSMLFAAGANVHITTDVQKCHLDRQQHDAL